MYKHSWFHAVHCNTSDNKKSKYLSFNVEQLNYTGNLESLVEAKDNSSYNFNLNTIVYSGGLRHSIRHNNFRYVRFL